MPRSKSTARKQPVKTNTILGKPLKKKTRRYRPGTVALREIRKYQKSTDFLIPKLPFERLVRETIQDLTPGQEVRLTGDALRAIREAAEIHVVKIFENTVKLSTHANRVTTFAKDMRLALNLMGEDDSVTAMSSSRPIPVEEPQVEQQQPQTPEYSVTTSLAEF